MKDKYRELFNKDVYAEECCMQPSASYSDEYVKWLEKQVKLFDLPVVVGQREQFDKFYAWLDGLTQGEYDDMSLTDKCEKFFFKT